MENELNIEEIRSKRRKCMIEKKKRITSVLLSTLLISLSVTGNMVYAEEPDTDESEQESDESLSDVISEVGKEVLNANLSYLLPTDEEEVKVIPEEPVDTTKYPKIYPDHFYLNDVDGKNYVSPVKMQNPWGTCWSFAAIAAAETSIMYESNMPVTQDDPNPLDLSEKQVAWFTYRPLSEKYENHQGGEGTYCIDENGNITNDPQVIYNVGGSIVSAEQLFTSAIGPVYEEAIPYKPAEANKDNYTEYAMHTEDGTPYFWKDTGDWTVPDDMRQYYSFALEETKELPSSANNNQEGVQAMKKELLEGRPIWIGYTADQYLPSQDLKTAEGKYIYVNEAGQCSQYTYQPDVPNHAVTVVGYNDSYSRHNFLEGHRPPGDGAWLIKNSWGASEKYNQFPNSHPSGFGTDGSGYFWLSYYDKSITCEHTLNFDLQEKTMNEEKRFVYEYDLLARSSKLNLPLEGESSYANVFKAIEKMNLKELGIFSQVADSNVSVSVYRIDKNAKNPTDGTLVTTLQKSFQYPGFHKIELPEKYLLSDNQRFSVVVTEEKDGIYFIPLQYAENENVMDIVNEKAGEILLNTYQVGIVNPGESYQYVDGTWSDLSDTIKEANQLLQDETSIQGGLLAIDNYSIKAYGE